MTSGRAATTRCQSIVDVCSPAVAGSGTPPASSICSGTQWPAGHTGSNHSSAKTRGRPATRRRTSSIRDRSGATRSAATSGTPSASPTTRRQSSTSSSVRGSRLSTRGPASSACRLGDAAVGDRAHVAQVPRRYEVLEAGEQLGDLPAAGRSETMRALPA
ncbi:hypothetical protein [Actinophytocola sp.]|uniref:hypothetical protein n=1 Tax=Actinophytocola sp. TaxID=1872138 RepID=UPI003D6B2E82